MAEDDDLERLLRRYRPAGPGDGLRARVLGPRFRRRVVVGWLSAAALLALAISLHVLASRTHGRIASNLDAGRSAAAAAELRWIAADLGDDDFAREMALRLVADRERRMRADAEAPAPPVEELWIQ